LATSFPYTSYGWPDVDKGAARKRELPIALENRRPEMYFIRKIVKNQKGATAIEYGLIAALIAVAAISAMRSVGSTLNSTFTNVSTQMGS
jgi:pilus assembly protein Flp/PilA